MALKEHFDSWESCAHSTHSICNRIMGGTVVFVFSALEFFLESTLLTLSATWYFMSYRSCSGSQEFFSRLYSRVLSCLKKRVGDFGVHSQRLERFRISRF